MPAWLWPLAGRWYSFVPWLLTAVLIVRGYGWRRALPFLVGGWAIAFAAEWGSTAGPGVPFGVYHYRPAGLSHDWTVLGVPLFDSLSFSWLAFCAYTALGAVGARGWRRVLLSGLAMAALDLVVDPVALRGARWWLGAIYSYPAGSGAWYGVSLLNYAGWLVVGAAISGWLRLWLGDRGPDRAELALAGALLVAVMLQSSILAFLLGTGPSALAAAALLAVCAGLGLRGRGPSPGPTRLLVACALAAESRAVRRALGGGWSRQSGRGPIRWISPGAGVEVWETGLGPEAARRAALARDAASPVLVAGVAGACAPGWRPGEVGLPDLLLTEDRGWLRLSPGAHRALVSAGLGRPCRLASSSLAAASSSDRRQLRERGAELVDMETGAWAGLPGARVVALRVVLDTPGSELGPAAGLVPAGRTRPAPAAVAALLLLHPSFVPKLLALGRDQRRALSALGDAVARAVGSLVGAAEAWEAVEPLPYPAEGEAGVRP